MAELDDIPRLTLFSIGKTPVTVGSLVAAILVVFGSFLLARLIGSIFRRVRSKTRGRATAPIYIAEKLGTYGIVIAGLLVAVDMLRINLTSLAVFAGAVGVGVGLGLQGIVKEFVSGLVLVFEGALQVGDYIELERGGRGMIKEIGPRATRVRNNDNLDILVPNSKLIEERVISWTFKGAHRRMRIPFSVPYGTDKSLVREAILEAAHAVPFTLPDVGDRKSQVWLVGFGEAGLNFELVVWPELSAVKRPNAVMAAYTWAIEDALCKAGLQIPYKQLDLHLRSVFEREGDEALRAMGLKQTRQTPQRGAGSVPSAPFPSANDAADDLEAARSRDIAKAQAEAEKGAAADDDDDDEEITPAE